MVAATAPRQHLRSLGLHAGAVVLARVAGAEAACNVGNGDPNRRNAAATAGAGAPAGNVDFSLVGGDGDGCGKKVIKTIPC